MHISILFVAFLSIFPFTALGVPVSMARSSAPPGVSNDLSSSLNPRAPAVPRYTVILDQAGYEQKSDAEKRKHILSIAMSKDYTSDTDEAHFSVLMKAFGFQGSYSEAAAGKIKARKDVKSVDVRGDASILSFPSAKAKYKVLMKPAGHENTSEAEKKAFLLKVATSKEYTTDTTEADFTVLVNEFGFIGSYNEKAAKHLRGRNDVISVIGMAQAAVSGSPKSPGSPNKAAPATN